MDNNHKELQEIQQLLYEARKQLFDRVHSSDQPSRIAILQSLDFLAQAFELVGCSHMAVVACSAGKTGGYERAHRSKGDDAVFLMSKARDALKKSTNLDLKISAELLHQSISCIAKS